jgi:hypothetical protein
MQHRRSKQLPLMLAPKTASVSELPPDQQREVVAVLAELLVAATDEADSERGDSREREDHR